MKLLIAEKPSVAVSNYRPLLEEMEGETFQKRDGYLQGKEWCISWCVGHLVSMAFPEEYGWNTWRLEDLPMLPKEWKYQIKKDTESQFNVLKELIGKATVIVNGADAGREGELIYRLVKELAGNPSAEERRLWINSFVMKDMAKGWKNLKPGHEYKRLYDSALSRAQSDWLVGMNFSRGYSIKTGAKQISVGRVQTPTLALLVQRDDQVENWKESSFYELKATWKGVRFAFYDDGRKDLENYAFVEMVFVACQGKEGVLKDRQENEKSNSPGKPFDLVGLQKEANKRLGLKAQDTLDITQKLYEAKLVTYPRTDSEYLPESMKDEAFEILEGLTNDEQKSVMRPKSDSFALFNSAKVSDHFAIIPTGQDATALSGAELSVYELILQRFVFAFAKPYKYSQTDLILDCEGYQFKASLKVEIERGFKALYAEEKEDQEEETQVFSGHLQAAIGDRSPMEDLQIETKKRSKPKYHTEGTLLGAMETAGREIEKEELREAMKGHGLGTPATRANIFEILKRREYVTVKGKYLVSTPKGRELIKVVDEKVSSPEMTGAWEYKLKEMEQGKYDVKTFMTEIETMVKEISVTFADKVEGFEQSMQTPETTCPKCQGVLRMNEHGVFCNNSDVCGMKVFRTVAKKKLSDKVLTDLVLKGKSGVVKGFQGKTKKFDAKLKLVDGKVEFDFS